MLKAYTVHRPEEGYCQAQAPIAAVLLMHMPAEVNSQFPVTFPLLSNHTQFRLDTDCYPGVCTMFQSVFLSSLCPRMRSGSLYRFVRSTFLDTTAQGW